MRRVWALAAVTVLVVGCGEDGSSDGTEPADTSAPASIATAGADTDKADEGDADPSGDDGRGGGSQGAQGEPSDSGGGSEAPDNGADDAAREDSALEARGAYEDYIDAINARDGAALCDLLSPASVRELRAPVKRASCSATLADSIGYRDPRGFPVWKRTSLNDVPRIQVSNDLESARITAMITTQFADRSEPSVESDIAYLELAGGDWRLAKPPGSLYRAVGNAKLPPSVIVPPKG